MNIIFSIVITTKNSIGVIERLVDILLNQEFNFPFELIFMDNNSTDGTLEFLKEVNFKNKRIIHVPEGEFSHSGTRMNAAELARGKYVLFFTDDIVPIGKDFLSHLTQPVLDNQASAAYGVVQIDAQNADPIDAYLHNDWYKDFESIRKPVSQQDWDSMTPFERRKICNFDNCSSCLDKEVLLKIGFPKVPYGEDMFLAKRLILSNHKIALVKEAKFYHWHKMSFFYFLERMCIDQHFSFREFQVIYVKSKLRVIWQILKRILHRALISLFRLRIPLKARFYWIFYNIKILSADFFGKYIGSLSEEVEKKLFSPLNKRLYRLKTKILEKVYRKSILRY